MVEPPPEIRRERSFEVKGVTGRGVLELERLRMEEDPVTPLGLRLARVILALPEEGEAVGRHLYSNLVS